MLDPYLEDMTSQIVDCGLKVHNALGPGLLESVYGQCLAFEFGRRGLQAPRQVAMPVVYDGIRMDTGYRLDLLVEEKLIVEMKSVDSLT